MGIVTNTFSFPSNAQGFVATPAASSGYTMAWDGTQGNPAGSLKSSTTIAGTASSVNNWEWSGTWQGLGVPAGQYVILAHVNNSYYVPTLSYSSGSQATPKQGPYTIRDSSGNVQATPWAGRTLTGVDPSWQSRTGSDVAIPDAIKPAATTIKIRLENTMQYMSGNGSATYYEDEVSVVMTYTTGSGTASASATANHPTISAAGTFRAGVVGTATLSRHPTISSAGINATAGTATLSRHPTINSAGTRTVPVYSGTTTLSRHPTIAVVSSAPIPNYTGNAALACGHPAVAATARRTTPTYAGTATIRTTTTIATTVGYIPFLFGDVTLFLAQNEYHAAPYERPPLFVRGSDVSNIGLTARTTLFLWGKMPYGPISPIVPLMIKTPTATASPIVPLCVVAPSGLSGRQDLFVGGGVFMLAQPASVPLFVESGGYGIASLNLAIATDPAPASFGRAPLYVPGQAAAPWLPAVAYLMTDGRDNPPYKPMNLAVVGVQPPIPLAGPMNLIVAGGNASLGARTTLFLANESQAVAADVQFFVRGDGMTPGAIPLGGGMSLSVRRGPQAGITLFVPNKAAGASVPLAIAGHPSLSRDTTLAIVGLGGTLGDGVTLAIPTTKTPTAFDAAATIAIPRTHGAQPNIQKLYINGWTQ